MSTLFLVGAGPGDPELITLKAIRVLAEADVILYDALANTALLDYAGKAVVKQFVGKRFGCHSLSQEEINLLILDYGRQYQRVVRLKGGDPFVFGRACEEILAARAGGMEVEMIPGLTSAITVPSLAGIPVTCRGVNESFWVLTGTTKTNELSRDIYLAAQSTATVIILMAMSKLETITDIFRQQGKSETPAAIIQNGTLPNEKIITGKVKDICFRAQHAELTNPAIIIIGEVVDWQAGAFRKELGRAVHTKV